MTRTEHDELKAKIESGEIDMGSLPRSVLKEYRAFRLDSMRENMIKTNDMAKRMGFTIADMGDPNDPNNVKIYSPTDDLPKAGERSYRMAGFTASSNGIGVIYDKKKKKAKKIGKAFEKANKKSKKLAKKLDKKERKKLFKAKLKKVKTLLKRCPESRKREYREYGETHSLKDLVDKIIENEETVLIQERKYAADFRSMIEAVPYDDNNPDHVEALHREMSHDISPYEKFRERLRNDPMGDKSKILEGGYLRPAGLDIDDSLEEFYSNSCLIKDFDWEEYEKFSKSYYKKHGVTLKTIIKCRRKFNEKKLREYKPDYSKKSRCKKKSDGYMYVPIRDRDLESALKNINKMKDARYREEKRREEFRQFIANNVGTVPEHIDKFLSGSRQTSARLLHDAEKAYKKMKAHQRAEMEEDDKPEREMISADLMLPGEDSDTSVKDIFRSFA